jgi:hypothetical protein
MVSPPTETPRPSIEGLCLRFDIRENLAQEVLGKPCRLLMRLLETLPTAVIWVAYHFGLSRPRVLAEEHHLRLAPRLALLHPLEICEVGPVHREYVVELVEVGCIDLPCRMHVVLDAMLLQGGQCPVVGFFAEVVGAWKKELGIVRFKKRIPVGYLPVPHESTFAIRFL